MERGGTVDYFKICLEGRQTLVRMAVLRVGVSSKYEAGVLTVPRRLSVLSYVFQTHTEIRGTFSSELLISYLLQNKIGKGYS
jgi:hypothetical protein